MTKAKLKHKAFVSTLGIIIAAVLFFSPVAQTPFFDTNTDIYFKDAITKAGLAYVTCRTINAAVSLIKESNLQLEPAGLGVSLAIGQVLDPLDDMTERLSDVLVTAITSLSVQKLSYEIGVSLAPQVFSLFLLILLICWWFENERLQSLQKITKRILILIAILRFCLPLSSLANDYLYKNYFAEKISTANNELRLRTESSNPFEDIAVSESAGFWATIGNSPALIKNTSIDLKKTIESFVTNMGEIIENLLNLTFLYVGVFLIQVIGLPIMMFWLLVKFANCLFDTNIPAILHSPRVSKDENVRISR
jgi:hypothetical protein